MAFDTGLLTFPSATTGDVGLLLWTDPLVTEALLPQSPAVNRRLSHSLAGTPSTDVGPSGPPGVGEGYWYLEASSPGAAGDDGIVEFEDQASPGNPRIFDASSQNITVTFETNQRGNDNDATCRVETNENGAGWVARGTVFGGPSDPDKVATGGTDTWIPRTVDLTGLISHPSTRIRIRTELQGATVWNADYGVGRMRIVGVDSVTREQRTFGFYEDGPVATSVAAQAEGVDHEVSSETTTQLRFQLVVAGSSAAPVGVRYKRATDGVAEKRFVPFLV